MARKGNPISVRLDLNRSSDSSWFSDYYYAKFLYQDVNLRSYFGSIRPPTRLTFGFRLGRCIIIHFPKRAFIHFFLPRRPRRLKRRDKSRPGKGKGRWWAFGKVGPIGCLHSSDKPCRLLLGDVWNGELTKMLNRPRLRNKKRSIKRKIYPRSNLNSYIQSRTTRRKKRNVLLLNVISEAIPLLLSSFCSLVSHWSPFAIVEGPNKGVLGGNWWTHPPVQRKT